MILLILLFVFIALLYASVGFGGGSTYTALLTLANTDYQILPIISLACNLLVVIGGTILFATHHTIPWRRALPICFCSVPFAWFGGRLIVSEIIFMSLLAIMLFLVGLTLLLQDSFQRLRKSGVAKDTLNPIANPIYFPHKALEIIIGCVIGFLSGLVGIGGGIFLSPVLFLLHWGKTREIAGTASLFILVNSAAGMVGQLQKLGTDKMPDVIVYWPLFLAVIFGGQIGSRLGASILPERWMRQLTAALVLFVSIRLFIRLFTQLGFL